MNFPFSCVILNQLRQQLPIDDLRTSDVNANICPSTDRDVAKTTTITRVNVYFLFVFVFNRIMQAAAWLLSVLVIGINMFFVVEYVVGSLHLC